MPRAWRGRTSASPNSALTAFEAQLDRLFEDDALDVSTDIDVMENMLRADGLTGNTGNSPNLQL